MYSFVPNTPFGSLLDFSQTNLFKTFNSEFNEIIVWFTNQNSEQLDIEERINLAMVIK